MNVHKMATASCTIVTSYYQTPSKHSHEQYDAWMTNFLTTVDNPLIIFTEEIMVKRLAELRKGKEDKTVIVSLPWEEMLCVSGKCTDYWNKDIKRDTEKDLHTPYLYILWNEKTAMVRRAMQINPFRTEFFCWTDIGCFRSAQDMDLFKEWPSQAFLSRAVKDRMYLLNIEPFKTGELEVLPNGLTRSFEGKNRIGGTIFIGHQDVWDKWFDAYYTTMELYMKHDYFAGKDQNLMATVVAKHPELVHLVQPSRLTKDGDPWFYMQRYLAVMVRDPTQV